MIRCVLEFVHDEIPFGGVGIPGIQQQVHIIARRVDRGHTGGISALRLLPKKEAPAIERRGGDDALL
jgi:hypothetical protein